MYGKLFRQMYRGTLASVGPWEVLVTFQQFIILADADGVVDMTPDAISRETTIPLEIIEKGIASLLEPDKYSRSPDEDGRRIIPLDDHRPWGWKIVNYLHYRALQNEMERREYHRKYWHKRKDKLNNSTTTQLNSTRSTDSTDAEEEGIRNKKKKKEPREERAVALVLHGSLPLKEWEEWLAHRRAKRWPLDGRTLAKQLSALSSHTEDEQREMINTSINAGWQGLFPPKSAAKKTAMQKITWHPSMEDE